MLDENSNFVFQGQTISQDYIESLSNEELIDLKDLASLWIGRYKSLSGSMKVFMNAMYGAQGSEYYTFANVQVASDITAEGRYYIHKGQEITLEYFQNEWHLDTELHKILFNHPKLKGYFGESKIETTYEDKIIKGKKVRIKIEKEILIPYTDFSQLKVDKMNKDDEVLYIDTDSIYVSFEQIMKTCNFNHSAVNGGSYVQFILAMNEFKMSKIYSERLGKIVAERHGENFLKFDLENISESVFFLKKKKYLCAHKWTDSGDVEYEHAYEHIKGKGIEIIQGSTPKAARKLLKYLMRLLFKGDVTDKNYQPLMRKAFEKFSDPTTPILNKCKLSNIGKYYDYVIDDKNELEFEPRVSPQIRGAARHNYLLRKKGYMTAYPMVYNQKVAWYYDKNDIPFSFSLDGEYPEEIAPEIDIIKQFTNLIAKPFGKLAELKGIDIGHPLDKMKVKGFEI